MDDNYEFKYIEPSNSEIKQIREMIKKQGDRACQNQLSIETISENAFTFGWIYISPKAQIGRRSIKSSNDKHTSFLLCLYTSLKPEYLTINLVCSINHLSKLLMDTAENRAKEMGIKGIELQAIPNDKLIKWYKSLGYVYINTIYLKSASVVPKVYCMIKRL